VCAIVLGLGVCGCLFWVWVVCGLVCAIVLGLGVCGCLFWVWVVCGLVCCGLGVCVLVLFLCGGLWSASFFTGRRGCGVFVVW
jgi:hypothetical protein